MIISQHLETSFVTTGTLATGTFVAFPVQGVAGNELRVEASGFDTVIEVTGLDGTIIATDDNGLGDGMGGSAVNFQMPGDGAATVTLRGIEKGEYIVNVHQYLATSREERVPVSVTVEKLNPTVNIVYYETVYLRGRAEETVVRFTLDDAGNVVSTSNEFKRLVKNK